MFQLYICSQRAEDETARLYAEFVESFQGDSAPGSKTFVRGGTINPNDKVKDPEGQCEQETLHLPFAITFIYSYFCFQCQCIFLFHLTLWINRIVFLLLWGHINKNMDLFYSFADGR